MVDDRKGPLEIVLLALMTLAILLPILAMATSLLTFADYPLRPASFALGAISMGLYLWVFHRSHADLGDNWSTTLQLRESHRLVATGIYRRIRHPMYAALYLRLSTAYQLGMPDGRTGAYGCHVSDRHGLADTFRCVADVRAG